MYKDANAQPFKCKDAYSGYLATAQVLASNASAYGDGGVMRIDKTMGRIQIRARAGAAGFVPAGNTTFALHDCATEGGSFNAMTGAPTLVVSAHTYTAGEDLGSIVVPHDHCEAFIKAYITAASSSTGTVDVFTEFMPG